MQGDVMVGRIEEWKCLAAPRFLSQVLNSYAASNLQHEDENYYRIISSFFLKICDGFLTVDKVDSLFYILVKPRLYDGRHYVFCLQPRLRFLFSHNNTNTIFSSCK